MGLCVTFGSFHSQYTQDTIALVKPTNSAKRDSLLVMFMPVKCLSLADEANWVG